MSGLRAPDPTLDALDADVKLYMTGWDERPLVAHLPGGLTDLAWMEEARDARWFAVPCPECFPDAPPPGHVWGADRGQRHIYRDSHLSWQVKPRRNQGDDDE